MRTGSEAVILQSVEKHYGDEFAFGPMELAVEEGMVTAIVGPNGSGKSTMFRLLMNLLQPDEGEVRIFGSTYSEGETAIKGRIGYVPELSDYDMAARRVGDIAAFLSLWYPHWSEAEYKRLLDAFGLKDSSKLKGMSKGTLRKVDLIMALAAQPHLLLLDEPSSGLDPLASGQLIDEVKRFMDQEGRTVLLATHIQEEVWKLADYVAFLYEGRLIGTYEKDELKDGWKAVWIERLPERPEELPGFIGLEGEGPYRIATRDYASAASRLKEEGIRILQTEALELNAILAQLIRERRNAARKS
ncbi:hypothetical protein J31TS4_47270 [Paenibacillus sp. J31TS4]|uniref:ABC transporter ATP-binding protein n=1 Tax=Paenibacillus sp. J31TS4 TaxID=2807195 RepID=UPI001B061624|nr:ABC transporter ATP-binding protein [Paenibacillus sp. J31TS4]GIP41447.1 hypothetical protein J31TS4_47270 [Paenibacillus sp. J31TS4]